MHERQTSGPADLLQLSGGMYAEPRYVEGKLYDLRVYVRGTERYVEVPLADLSTAKLVELSERVHEGRRCCR